MKRHEWGKDKYMRKKTKDEPGTKDKVGQILYITNYNESTSFDGCKIIKTNYDPDFLCKWIDTVKE